MSPSPSTQVQAQEDLRAPYRTYVREFFVDFLGSLVPGFLFTVGSGLLLVWALYFAWRCWAPPAGANDFMRGLESVRFELLGLTLAVSYVLGGLFYRRDPKEPDRESATKLYAGATTLTDTAVGDLQNVEYPYLNLRGYLEKRGLNHLADKVPWSMESHSSSHRRSKMFINVLKIRLQFLVPHKCGDLVRHEAHVRMMSSVWYAARAMRKVAGYALLAACLGVPGLWLDGKVPNQVLTRTLTEFAVFTAVILGVLRGCGYLTHSIRSFFHYQRVREVVQVLETAYTAGTLLGLDVFGSLSDRTEEAKAEPAEPAKSAASGASASSK